MLPVADATKGVPPPAVSLGQPDNGPSMLTELLATVCLVWYIAVLVVSAVGYTQLRRWYSSPPPPAHSVTSVPEQDVPHVTAIRPVKGLEPSLYECLAATFRQTYPRDKLSVCFCVSSRDDPAVPTIERLLADFPSFDAKILVEEEDPALNGGDGESAGRPMGPNPKIRNMSRAYREAKGDIVWVIDCNVWIGTGVAGRMVDTLCGFGGKKKNKFVHQLPLVVDTQTVPRTSDERRGLLDSSTDGNPNGHVTSTSTASTSVRNSDTSGALQLGGGRLEEVFMSSAHAKFYTAINTVLLAPCIVGKSNMFRRTHLNALTDDQGIDFFSQNICEDHLIGDRLWRKFVPGEEQGERWGKHALVFGDLAIQPMAGMSVGEYIARRVRWLRVRKFTVTLATLVEPGTESFLCSLYGAYAITTLQFFRELGVPQTWTAFWVFFVLSVSIWATVDWTLFCLLHSGSSIEVDGDTPSFALPSKARPRRRFAEWLFAWLGREALAWPIWAWAVWGGVSVMWRGKRFWVGMDMKVHEIKGEKNLSKARRD
ncbi:glycosyltransferase family 21 protein [Saccharata proteae CBS 121410]|uniref:Ceramide glucosyltransferase n=1 Tax=Saccharata proteae CBS 121410 TaxID=1314787 RepID=A0A9P4M2G9_9PEZI|nr:glycosyltransferase family 21 protein [Saccharata proteae CBS 121410]